MRKIDAYAIKTYKIPSIVLMQNAARAAFDIIRDRVRDYTNKEFIIICGRGNNAGDGLALAIILLTRGLKCRVYMLYNNNDLTQDARIYYNILYRAYSDAIIPGSIPPANLNIKPNTIIIDAIFGTGFNGQLPDKISQLFKYINNSSCFFRISLDIPSGINGDTGHGDPNAFMADITITFGLHKPGLFVGMGLEHCGEVYIDGIGIPRGCQDDFKHNTFLLEKQDIRQYIYNRPRISHKGDYGRVLIVAGSRGMYGAPYLAAIGALRAGAGIVKLALPDNIEHILGTRLTETMTIPLKTLDNSGISPHNNINGLDGFDVMLIGPGLGQHKDTQAFIRKTIDVFPGTVIIDADGIRALDNAYINRLNKQDRAIVLTPHPGEFHHLFNTPIEEQLRDPIGHYRKVSIKSNAHIIGKIAAPFISEPDGTVFLTGLGNPGMAVGGMGDLLAGMIAGFIASRGNGRTISESIRLGVYLHALLGDYCSNMCGIDPLTPSDMIRHFGTVYKGIRDEIICKPSQ